MGGEDGFGDFDGALIDVIFGDRSAGAEVTEVRHEITETERRMDVFGVERGEQDVRHGTSVGGKRGQRKGGRNGGEMPGNGAADAGGVR